LIGSGQNIDSDRAGVKPETLRRVEDPLKMPHDSQAPPNAEPRASEVLWWQLDGGWGPVGPQAATMRDFAALTTILSTQKNLRISSWNLAREMSRHQAQNAQRERARTVGLCNIFVFWRFLLSGVIVFAPGLAFSLGFSHDAKMADWPLFAVILSGFKLNVTDDHWGGRHDMGNGRMVGRLVRAVGDFLGREKNVRYLDFCAGRRCRLLLAQREGSQVIGWIVEGWRRASE